MLNTADENRSYASNPGENLADGNILSKIDALLRKTEALSDSAAKRLIEDTIRALMKMHGEGMSRMMEMLSERDDGYAVIDSLASDPLIGSLLLVYDLHPLDMTARVRSALDSVAPYLASHGGSVELLGISHDGVVNLQMQGSCHGCPSSAVTLKSTIEKSIYDKAPDVIAIHVQGLETPPAIAHSHHAGNGDGFVPIEQVTAGHMRLPLARAPFAAGAAL